MVTKKKLLIILPWNADGAAGIEKCTVILSNYFSNSFKIYIAVIVNQPIEKEEIRNKFNANIKTSVIIAPRARASVLKIAQKILQIDPDLILCNAFHICVATILAKFMVFSRSKLISVSHGVDPTHFDNPKERLQIRFVALFSHKIISVSQGVKHDLTIELGISPKKIEVIHNPFDVEAIYQQSSVPIPTSEVIWDSNKKSIIYVGRFEEHQKSVGTILKSVALMANRNIHINLLLVGDGEGREDLIALSQYLHIRERVFFLGWKENPYQFIKNSSALVLSSRYEGLPTVLIEALACGTPVVSTDCHNGPSEIIDENRYGRLVPIGDIEKFSEAISDILMHPISAELLIGRAKDFSIEKSVNQYIQLFNRTLP